MRELVMAVFRALQNGRTEIPQLDRLVEQAGDHTGWKMLFWEAPSNCELVLAFLPVLHLCFVRDGKHTNLFAEIMKTWPSAGTLVTFNDAAQAAIKELPDLAWIYLGLIEVRIRRGPVIGDAERALIEDFLKTLQAGDGTYERLKRDELLDWLPNGIPAELEPCGA